MKNNRVALKNYTFMKMTLLPNKNPYRHLVVALLHKARCGNEKAARQLKILRRHTNKLEGRL